MGNKIYGSYLVCSRLVEMLDNSLDRFDQISTAEVLRGTLGWRHARTVDGGAVEEVCGAPLPRIRRRHPTSDVSSGVRHRGSDISLPHAMLSQHLLYPFEHDVAGVLPDRAMRSKQLHRHQVCLHDHVLL